MYREPVQNDIIDLGAVTTETRGGHWGFMDQEGSLRTMTGLSDD